MFVLHTAGEEFLVVTEFQANLSAPLSAFCPFCLLLLARVAYLCISKGGPATDTQTHTATYLYMC